MSAKRQSLGKGLDAFWDMDAETCRTGRIDSFRNCLHDLS